MVVTPIFIVFFGVHATIVAYIYIQIQHYTKENITMKGKDRIMFSHLCMPIYNTPKGKNDL